MQTIDTMARKVLETRSIRLYICGFAKGNSPDSVDKTCIDASYGRRKQILNVLLSLKCCAVFCVSDALLPVSP